MPQVLHTGSTLGIDCLRIARCLPMLLRQRSERKLEKRNGAWLVAQLRRPPTRKRNIRFGDSRESPCTSNERRRNSTTAVVLVEHHIHTYRKITDLTLGSFALVSVVVLYAQGMQSL